MNGQIESQQAHQKSTQRAGNERAAAKHEGDPRRMPRSRQDRVSGNGRRCGEYPGHEQLTPQTSRGQVAAAAQVECRRQRVEAEVDQPERERDAQEQEVADAPRVHEPGPQQPGGAEAEEREHHLQRRAKRRRVNHRMAERERKSQHRRPGHQHRHRAARAARHVLEGGRVALG